LSREEIRSVCHSDNTRNNNRVGERTVEGQLKEEKNEEKLGNRKACQSYKKRQRREFYS